MYRVVTRYRNQSPRPVVERGPWHETRQQAEQWADLLREHGYETWVENQNGLSSLPADDNHALADALASMA